MFEEVVDHAEDTKITATEYFDAQQKKIKTAATLVRPGGILLQIQGLFLLFSPVIAVLKWIPLVGWLLGGVMWIAAYVFAIVVGLVVSCLVIAIAWIFYRPILGISLLLLTGVSVFLIFYMSGEEGEAISDGSKDDSATTVAAQIASNAGA